MAGLGWLHLTDLHVGTTGTLWQRPRYREEMERDLAWLHERVGSFDLILVTGDLASTGTETEYGLVTQGLASLQHFLARFGSRPALLAVPGNNDLVRTLASAAPDPTTWELDPDARETFFKNPTHPSRRAVAAAFAPFAQWMARWRKLERPTSVDIALENGLLPGDFVATVTKEGRRFGIAGLNTAFLELSMAGAFGALDVDPRQIEATVGDLDAWARSHDACLLLTHHPPSGLSPRALVRFSDALAPRGRFVLHLVGSVDDGEPLVDDVHTPLFSGLPFTPGIGGDRRHGYTAGRLDTDTGEITLWPRILGFSPSMDPRFEGPAYPAPGEPLRVFVRKPPSESARVDELADDVLELPTAAEFAPELEAKPIVLPAPEPLESKKKAAPAPPPRPPPPMAAPAAFAASPAPERAPGATRGLALGPASAPASASASARAATPAPASAPASADVPSEFTLVRSLPIDRGPLARVRFSPTGDTLAAISFWGKIHVWDADTQSNRWIARAGSDAMDLCYAPDGRRIATRSGTNLSIWDTSNGECLRTLHEVSGTSLAWSPENILAVGQPDGKILFLDADELSVLGHLDHGFCPGGIFGLAFSPDAEFLVSGGKGDGFVAISTIPAGSLPQNGFTRAAHFHRGSVFDFAFRPRTPHVASAADDGTIAVWSLVDGAFLAKLEGHPAAVTSLSFSHDGRLLASRSRDGLVLLWRTDTWEPVARLRSATNYLAGAAFSPTEPSLAIPSPTGALALFTVDIDALRGRAPSSTTLHTTTAKVVLLGEGRAGKSCLALRLAEDRYEEQPSTHGMRFWSIADTRLPREAPVPKNHRRELVVWDLGGQDEYRLVHPLFLQDTSLALLVFEPGRGKAAENEIASWNDHLGDGGEHDGAPRRLLVGTKLDDAERAPEDRAASERLRARVGALAYVPTSARTGRGTSELKSAILGAIDWSSLGPTSRPVLFERIRAHVERARRAGRAVLTLLELEASVAQDETDAELAVAIPAVASQLARQGLVADIRLSDGTRALVLEVEQISRYAGSLILLARDNPHGVPALAIATLLGPAARFPRIPPGERLRKDQELGVLDGVIALLLEQGTCFLHEGLLVFPALFPALAPAADPADPAAAPLPAAIRYEMSRPASEVYASAVTALALGRRFGPARLGPGRADFGLPGEGLSRLSISQAPGGKARGGLEVAFSPDTPDEVRRLFAGFLEDHLQQRGVHFVERASVRCACGYVLPEDTVKSRLVGGHSDIGCPECDARTPLVPRTEGKDALAAPIFALRREAERRREESVEAARMAMAVARVTSDKPPAPIRILHLSDLHLHEGDDPDVLLQPLLTDLRDRVEGLALEKLDFVVVSGDLSNRASPGELEAARHFLSRLAEAMGLTADRCIVVPGNHDLDWDTEVYDFKKRRAVDPKRLAPGSFVEQESGYLVRDDARYPDRFRNFSRHLYHPLCLREYPLTPEEQGLALLFPAERIQFVSLNSAFEIDEYHRGRSAIHPGALSRALAEAERQIEEARRRGDLDANASVLRFAVFHHPVTGNEKMADDAFLERLRRADVRAVLHGHVHEDRADLVGYLHPARRLHVVGAGSFGAPADHRPASVPRLYNLITIPRDLGRMRVDTRSLRKDEGIWEPWYTWPGEKPGERRAHYEVRWG
ncbi:metallophosphoesterase [Polyangium sp. y55x31]|uniref:metallophosphoesterase n=1 Tax=Polyangium sp. y55x31 TaxID=3042688 RepID=UPI002482813C|nr:metallophosphoesterase [Polyangium sp. y55x31]MDI1481444.1 metallophosphoesterase [Polyangium sp. y55x31]